MDSENILEGHLAFIECFTTTFLRAHSWLNWVEEGHLARSRFNFFGELLLKYSKLNYYNYIPEISNFGDIMVLVRTPPHAKACVSRNCDTKVRIKFIFDTAIDDLEWKNPIDFGANRQKIKVSY